MSTQCNTLNNLRANMPFMGIVVLAAHLGSLALQLWHPVQAQQHQHQTPDCNDITGFIR